MKKATYLFVFVLSFFFLKKTTAQIYAGQTGSGIISGVCPNSFVYNYTTSGQYTGNCALDIDTDGTNDFVFGCYNTNSGSGGYPTRELNVGFIGSIQILKNASGYPRKLPSGTLIDSGGNWSYTNGILQQIISLPVGTGTFGEWNPGDAFVGFRLITAVDTSYGYIHVVSPNTLANYQVLEFGYEQSMISVEETGFVDYQLFPNPFSDFIRIETNEIDEIVMYDVCSKIISDNLFHVSVQLNTSELPAGIFICEMRKEGRIISRKKMIKISK